MVVSPFSLPLGEISDAEMLGAIRANLFTAVFFFLPISFRALMPFGFNGAAPSLLFSPGCIYRRRAHPHLAHELNPSVDEGLALAVLSQEPSLPTPGPNGNALMPPHISRAFRLAVASRRLLLAGCM